MILFYKGCDIYFELIVVIYHKFTLNDSVFYLTICLFTFMGLLQKYILYNK